MANYGHLPPEAAHRHAGHAPLRSVLASLDLEYLGDVAAKLGVHAIEKLGQAGEGEYSLAAPPSPPHYRSRLLLEGVQDCLLALGHADLRLLGTQFNRI